ncbi:MAG TPA: LON peptidase substrate-binding domain-containing protein [Acidimicrobiales bacterium]|nr:LON peptidase substrate-binding domain-containing protein [Acidimicrobiales bacterium]
MFPLGSVLFPTAVLPLHVFEPRYLQLAEDCLAGDREFGVVLIERGSEVGGEDVRSSVGTVARIVESQQFEDRRWALAAVGVRRIRVSRWLPDDPYPLAEVTDWPDPAPTRDLGPDHDEITNLLRRCLGLAAEVGEAAAPATIELSDDPVVGALQASFLAPIGPLDQQRLLGAPSPEVRSADLIETLAETAEVLVARLALG